MQRSRRRYIHAFGANAHFTAVDMEAGLDALDGAARVLYVGGYLLMPRLAPEELVILFARARSRSQLTVLAVAGVPPSGGLKRAPVAAPHRLLHAQSG